MKEKESVRVKQWDQQSDTSEELNMDRAKNQKKTPSPASSVSEYNQKELEYLDKFLPEVENAIDVIAYLNFQEPELYDIIIDCNFDDRKIREHIKEKIRYIKLRGEDFGWNVIDKGHKMKPIESKSHNKESEHNTNQNYYQQGGGINKINIFYQIKERKVTTIMNKDITTILQILTTTKVKDTIKDTNITQKNIQMTITILKIIITNILMIKIQTKNIITINTIIKTTIIHMTIQKILKTQRMIQIMKMQLIKIPMNNKMKTATMMKIVIIIIKLHTKINIKRIHTIIKTTHMKLATITKVMIIIIIKIMLLIQNTITMIKQIHIIAIIKVIIMITIKDIIVIIQTLHTTIKQNIIKRDLKLNSKRHTQNMNHIIMIKII